MNKKVSKSLQSKLLVRIFTVLIILICIVGLFQYNNMKKYLYNSRVEFLDSRFKNINKDIIVGTNSDEALNKNSKKILEEISVEDVCVSIIDKSGDILAYKNTYTGIPTSNIGNNSMPLPTFSREYYKEILNSKKFIDSYSIIKGEDGKKQIVIWRQLGDIDNPSGLVQISTYLGGVTNILVEQTRLYILSALFLIIIGAALVVAVLKSTLKPLNNMTKTLEIIDKEALDIRLEENSGLLEIDKLSSKFNSMFERLEKSFFKEKQMNDKMKNFILDASHELRTPLTSIQGFVEVLQMGAAKNKDQLEVALDSILMESQRLSKLVNNLLLLTKLENNFEGEMKIENINSILMEIYPQLSMLMKGREFKVNYENEEPYCYVNKDQIKQVIYNLVQNAINYTDDTKGRIIIGIKTIFLDENRCVELSVEDNGNGIPKENLGLIFDRFYRVDSHRARKKGGYGLGLSIVKSIVDNHNGEISVKSEINKGTTFIILFKEVKN